jgi:hypothetical protein
MLSNNNHVVDAGGAMVEQEVMTETTADDTMVSVDSQVPDGHALIFDTVHKIHVFWTQGFACPPVARHPPQPHLVNGDVGLSGWPSEVEESTDELVSTGTR